MMEQIPQINKFLKKLIQAVQVGNTASPSAKLGEDDQSQAGEHVCMDGVPQGHVIASERMAKTPQKMALNLLGIFFSKDQLKNGNCTPTASHKEILDPWIINDIRQKCT
ncbi:hypothetical protein EMCRGX_G005618 [Ephydatia muelleri]